MVYPDIYVGGFWMEFIVGTAIIVLLTVGAVIGGCMLRMARLEMEEHRASHQRIIEALNRIEVGAVRTDTLSDIQPLKEALHTLEPTRPHDDG